MTLKTAFIYDTLLHLFLGIIEETENVKHDLPMDVRWF